MSNPYGRFCNFCRPDRIDIHSCNWFVVDDLAYLDRVEISKAVATNAKMMQRRCYWVLRQGSNIKLNPFTVDLMGFI